MSSKIIITGRHLSETSSKDFTHKIEKLLSHNVHIVRIRLDLHENSAHNGAIHHTAKAVIELRGPDLVASDTSENLFKAVHNVVEKLDRMLSERAHRATEERRHPHAVDIPADLPKVTD